ncbi:MAG: DUF3783 domain-containing protein [Clostridiales bacterium]|nr:DUF3783 domain-containing protein [Clostridiales bacterium]
MPVILLYNLHGERGMHIRMIALKLKLRMREVHPDEIGQPVGALAGLLPAHPHAEPTPFDDEMIVFVNFDRALLDRFLQEMRAARLPGVALKAVLTPTNMHWTSGQLHDEISREHEAMRYRNSVHKS